MGGSRRFLAAAVALVAAGLAVPAGATSSVPFRLTIAGQGRVVADVTLPAVTLNYRDLRVKGSGAYAAFYLEPLDRGRNHAAGSGALTAPGHTAVKLGTLDGEYSSGYGSSWSTRLRAGRYRVHLVADGPATLTLAAAGLPRDLRVTAVRPSADAVTTPSLTSQAEWVPTSVKTAAVRGTLAPAPHTLYAATTRANGWLHSDPREPILAPFCLRVARSGSECLDGDRSNDGREWMVTTHTDPVVTGTPVPVTIPPGYRYTMTATARFAPLAAAGPENEMNSYLSGMDTYENVSMVAIALRLAG